MMALYWFFAAAGVPLVVFFLLSGGDDGSGDGGSIDDGIGGIMLRFLPLSSFAIAAATFGICGLILDATGNGARTTFVGAAALAVAAASVNSTLFALLRRPSASVDVGDERLTGAMGRVVLPVAGERRGRVAVAVGDRQIYLSARNVPDAPSELEVGAPVLVVEMCDGVATVARLDPELT